VNEEKNPRQIFERYQKGEFDRDSVVKVLISLIEESEDKRLRLESLEVLNKLESKDPQIIKLIQHLLISDSDDRMRYMAAKMLIERFLSQSHSEVRWALENDPSIDNLQVIIESLRIVDEGLLGCFLKGILKDIICGVSPVKRGIRMWYYLDLRKLFDRRDIAEFSHEELVEIYLNYRILLGMEDKYDLDANYCHPMLKDGLIDSLNLTGLGIEEISEIQNLNKLTNLGSLDLSGNKIQEISGLEHLQNLGHLNLSFNRITEIKNLDTLVGLEGLELEGNQISEIKGLDKLVNIKFLTLGENRIRKIQGLKKLRFLHEFCLNSNEISVIENLGKLKNLHFLVLDGNPIKEIRGLKKLKKMKFWADIMDLID